MELHKVYTVHATQDDCLLFDMEYTEGEDSVRAIVAYRASDPYGELTPLIRKWLKDNPDQEVLPYIPPPEPTPEELRAEMPTLTACQFWLAANTLGITEDMLLAATDDAEIIIEIRKTTEFHRTYDSVIMLAPLMGITADQLDNVWLWAAAV